MLTLKYSVHLLSTERFGHDVCFALRCRANLIKCTVLSSSAFRFLQWEVFQPSVKSFQRVQMIELSLCNEM